MLFAAFIKLIQLDRNIKVSTKKGYQPGSSQNLRSYINRYLDFCLEYLLPPVLADGIQLRRFAQYLADMPTISAIETVKNYIWGLKTFHKLLGLPPPDTSEFLTTLQMRGLRLTLARPVRQAEPITPQILEKIFTQVDITSQEQVVAWTALLYCFHMLLRKSNLVPDTQSKFDPDKQLSRQRLCLALNTVLVDLVWCKTLQFKEKVLPLPLIQLANKVICPVHWTWILVNTVQASAQDPIFCYNRKGKFMVLTYPRLTHWFKKWLHEAGVPNKGFSLHSFRRGGVSFLHKANIPGQIIKILGNWASEAYLRYVDVTLGKRVEAACQFARLVDGNE